MTSPHLSFIVAVYNSEESLPATLDSLLEQDADIPYEVVVIDDGSKDSSWQIIALYQQRFPHLLQAERCPVNQGAGAARNRAVRNARSDLLYVVDSDNILPSDSTRKHLACLARVDVEAVSVEEIRFFSGSPSDQIRTWKMVHTDGIVGIQEAFSSPQSPPSHGNYLFSRRLFDAVGGYEIDAGAVEAWTFGMKHILAGFPVAICRDSFYFHRVGHESHWVRYERSGYTDRYAVRFLKSSPAELPLDLEKKIARLRSIEPFFTYLGEGAFSPMGTLPSPPRRVMRASAVWLHRGLGRLRLSASRIKQFIKRVGR